MRRVYLITAGFPQWATRYAEARPPRWSPGGYRELLVPSPTMDRDLARQQLVAQLQARTQLIQDELRPGERVLDCGEVNELGLNTFADLGAGEALLFVTDQRFVFHRSGDSESWDYGDVREFRLTRAPRGVPQRMWFRQLALDLAGGEARTMIGGRMFMAEVKKALRGH